MTFWQKAVAAALAYFDRQQAAFIAGCVGRELPVLFTTTAELNATVPMNNDCHERIFEVAEELFAERGFNATRMEDVARANLLAVEKDASGAINMWYDRDIDLLMVVAALAARPGPRLRGAHGPAPGRLGAAARTVDGTAARGAAEVLNPAGPPSGPGAAPGTEERTWDVNPPETPRPHAGTMMGEPGARDGRGSP